MCMYLAFLFLDGSTRYLTLFCQEERQELRQHEARQFHAQLRTCALTVLPA